MSNLSQEPTTVKNPLINKKIFIYPVIREGGWLNDIHKHHDGAFLFTGAKIIIQGVPFDQSTGRLIDPLTDSEKEFYYSSYSALQIERNRLSIYDKDCYWNDFTMKLTKEPLMLNLNDALDFLKYKFLMAQKDLIAPSWDERYNTAIYKYAVRDIEQEEDKKVDNINKKHIVMETIAKNRNSFAKLVNILKLYYLQRNMVRDFKRASLNTLIIEIDKITEQDIKGLYDLLQDKNYAVKMFIYDAIDCGAITQVNAYEYKIAEIDNLFLMRDLVDFISSAKNQGTRVRIQQMIDAKQKT